MHNNNKIELHYFINMIQSFNKSCVIMLILTYFKDGMRFAYNYHHN